MKNLITVTAFAATSLLVGCSSSGNDPSPLDPNESGDVTNPTPVESTQPEPNPPAPVPAPEPTPEPDVVTPDAPAPAEVRYRITFDSDWSAATHPVQFPSANPHFSGLVGAVHNEQVIFWEPGQIATDGIELMAETGGKSRFLSEIEEAMAIGNTLAAIDGSGISTSDGQSSVEVTVTDAYPQVTITTMMAPSPDWFVGLHNYPLFDGEEFIAGATVDAVLYDAGTDSGVSYTSSNADTDPRDPIARVSSESQDTSFVDGLPIVGRFIIERVQ